MDVRIWIVGVDVKDVVRICTNKPTHKIDFKPPKMILMIDSIYRKYECSYGLLNAPKTIGVFFMSKMVR